MIVKTLDIPCIGVGKWQLTSTRITVQEHANLWTGYVFRYNPPEGPLSIFRGDDEGLP